MSFNPVLARAGASGETAPTTAFDRLTEEDDMVPLTTPGEMLVLKRDGISLRMKVTGK